jgi:predicted transcriptional regulator
MSEIQKMSRPEERRSEAATHLDHADDFRPLPGRVDELCTRMREIATIVYLNGGATARDVQARIPDALTIYGIRTMLNRLAKKGIVKRRRSGRHTEIVYLPAILSRSVLDIAGRRFIDRNFNGSVSTALQSVLRLIASQ